MRPQPAEPAPSFDTDQNPVAEFDLKLHRDHGFRFRVDFDDEEHPPLWLDEPPPLGKNSAPNAARVLAAAIGDCLASSLLFSMRKAGAELESLNGSVHVEVVRNKNRRLRIGRIKVKLDPQVAQEHQATLKRCLATFEDFCMVTQSVRAGINVEVEAVTR